jgi:hypothetical protein
MKFRTLYADEIECRAGNCTEKGFTLLLYKDARVDMNLLDETVGCMNWKREHEVVNDNLYCTVSIWDDMKQQWVSKQDVGTESNTEAVKGESSDSFKRACFNIGIGRELYTAPLIWINANTGELTKGSNGKFKLTPSAKFFVSTIEYNDKREISKLIIVDKDGKTRFSFGVAKTNKPQPKKEEPKVEKQEYTNETIVGETIDDLFGDTRMMAIQEANSATTMESLKAVWDSYKMLQSDKLFISAVNQRKSKFANGTGK